MPRRTDVDMDYLGEDDRRRYPEPTPDPTFGCQGCGQEYYIEDGVVFEKHPEMPIYCWSCAHG